MTFLNFIKMFRLQADLEGQWTNVYKANDKKSIINILQLRMRKHNSNKMLGGIIDFKKPSSALSLFAQY